MMLDASTTPSSGESGGILASSIPFPDPSTLNTYRDNYTSIVVDSTSKPTRKSHARRQPPGHIPRPRNAFILFRCDFVRQKKVPTHVETNHRNISRIAGMLWKEMSKEQKQPWVELAEAEKKLHEERFPGYRYRPGQAGGNGWDAGDDLNAVRRRDVDRDRRGRRGRPPLNSNKSPYASRSAMDNPQRDYSDAHMPPVPQFRLSPILHRRSSSCPPPNSVPVQNPRDVPQFMYHQTTRDDLSQRRPSRVTFYQSAGSSSLLLVPPSPSSVPPMYWNPPLELHHFPKPVAEGVELQQIMPTCPPGWDSSPPRAERWNQWSDDVEKDFVRNVVMRSHDFDNSFQHGVPEWTNGLFNTPAVDSKVQFTNPFASSSPSKNNESATSSTAPSDALISPLDRDSHTQPHFDLFNDMPRPVLYDLDVGFDNSLYQSNMDKFIAEGSFHEFYQNPLPDLDNVDVDVQLGQLMPRLSLVNDSLFMLGQDEAQPDSALSGVEKKYKNFVEEYGELMKEQSRKVNEASAELKRDSEVEWVRKPMPKISSFRATRL